jgi:D-alanyl-D-alanine carboxypeptidase
MPLRLAATAVAIVAFLLAPAAEAGSRTAFQQQLARALQARHVSPARTGAIVLDLRTGQTLFAHNAQLALRPASNEKLATTYAALTALGPTFRIETDVLGDGRQSGTTWQGDLVLKGYGDPALTSAQIGSLARQVAADGIEHVSGRILGDESWFDTRRTGLGWKAQFYLHESPALSALIVPRSPPPSSSGATCGAPASASTARRESAWPRPTRFRWPPSSPLRSRACCGTWTSTATTSTPRCC